MVDKRGAAGKKILDRLKSGPAYPREISEELGIPLSTVNHNLRKVLPNLGLIKQLKNGKYADQNFSPQIEKVKNAYKLLRRKLFRSPKPDEVAYILKKPLAKTRDLLVLHVPGYSEPTPKEIAQSNQELWKVINTGLDLPDRITLINDGIKYIVVYGMDKEILFANYNRRDKNSGFDQVRFNKSSAYLREFPDMSPKIISQERKNDRLFIIIDWSDLPIVLPELSRTEPECVELRMGLFEF